MSRLVTLVLLVLSLSLCFLNGWSLKLHASFLAPVQQNNTMLQSFTDKTDMRLHDAGAGAGGVPLGSLVTLTNSRSKLALAAVAILGSGVILSRHRTSFADLNKKIHSFIPSRDTAFMQSFLLVFLSELGDKTFFMAALLAAKYGKLVAFGGAMSALLTMTIISTAIGQLFRRVPKSIANGLPYNKYIAATAFGFFGIKILWETLQSCDKPGRSGMEEERAEAEEIVDKVTKRSNIFSLLIQIFSLVFAAEVGDRSFLSTIALSSTVNPIAVGMGALSAHGVASGIAVIGGTIISKYLSEKAIALFGAALFLFFSVTTALGLL